jgi:hypothetical protein
MDFVGPGGGLVPGDERPDIAAWHQALQHTNDEVLAVDRAGHPARPVSQAAQQQVWNSENTNGSYAVALFNLGDTPATVAAKWSDLGADGQSGWVRDLWTHKNLGVQQGGFSATRRPTGRACCRYSCADGGHGRGGRCFR